MSKASDSQSFLNSALFDMGYVSLKALSSSSNTYLCRESATQRLLVIKFFLSHHGDKFLNEAQTLHHLKDCSLAPNLMFASTLQDGTGALGMEYSPGLLLVDWNRASNDLEKIDVLKQLELAVRQIHRDWGIAHKDLSPKNILVYEQMGPKNNKYQIKLVDWEFAEKICKENVQSYNAYRGTQGFSGSLELQSGAEKDLMSLKKISEFLDIKDISHLKNRSSWLTTWLSKS